MRKAFSVVGATLLVMPSLAAAQDGSPRPRLPVEEPSAAIPSSRPPSQFRQIYHCEQSKPPSASALGEIAGSKMIAVVGPSGKGKALVRESLPGETFGAGIFPGTRLELQPDLPCSAAKLAVLTPPNRVGFVQLKETSAPSAIRRVIDYFDARNKTKLPRTDADELLPSVFLTNYHIADAKAFSLTPRYTVIRANITYDAYVLVDEKPTQWTGIQVLGRKYEKEPGPSEPIPMLFVVGDEVTELNKDARAAGSICDELVSAFRISDRMYIHMSSNGCNNGIKGQMVFDLSGAEPRAVFSDWDLSD